MPFNDAHAIVLKDVILYNLDTERKWRYQKKYGYIRPNNTPYDPSIIYKNAGWVSWGHWLGTKNIRGTLRKYDVDDNFFQKWSGEMAYVLGFWWADGYMRERRDRISPLYGFSICQQTKYKYILEKILKVMSSNNPICCPKTRPSMSHFEICSKEIFESLIELGGTPNKSKTITMPNNMADEYVPDFIRGLFDGDGCITINKRNNVRSSYICSGNLDFIISLKNLMDKFKIKGAIQNNSNKKNICFKLVFSTNATKKLGMFMYGNVLSDLKLDRKYNKFIEKGEPIWKNLAA